LIEQEVPRSIPLDNRFVADADADEEAALARPADAPLSLVIGPAAGLIPHELEQFAQSGLRLVRAGRQPLRVETALSYLTGQMRAARARSAAEAAPRPPAG